MLDWSPGPNNGPLYWGMAEGSFDELGAKLKLVTPSDTSAPLKLVASNKIDLAMSYEADTLVSGEQGLGVTAVGAVYPGAISGILTMPDSGIKRPEDLKGKKIGYSGIPAYKAILDQMLRTAGVENDVEIINTGFNDMPALFAGRVDALGDSYATWQAAAVEVKTGKPAVFFRNRTLGVPEYNELVFVANARRLKDDKKYAERVNEFLEAYEVAVRGAVDDPEKTLAELLKVSERDPDQMKLAVPTALKEMSPSADNPHPGCMSVANWTTFAEWMVSNKLLKQQPDIESVMTNEFQTGPC